MLLSRSRPFQCEFYFFTFWTCPNRLRFRQHYECVCVCVCRAAGVKMLTVVSLAFSPLTPNPHFHSGHSPPAAGSTQPKHTELSVCFHYLSVEVWRSVQAFSSQELPALHSHSSTHSHLRAVAVRAANHRALPSDTRAALHNTWQAARWSGQQRTWL